MFHVRGYDASGGVKVHPHEVSHQLGDGGCTNLVGAVRVHALQLHAPFKLMLFAVLGDENKACMQYWGGGGGGHSKMCSSKSDSLSNSCSSQSWGMKTKHVHNTGGRRGKGSH